MCTFVMDHLPFSFNFLVWKIITKSIFLIFTDLTLMHPLPPQHWESLPKFRVDPILNGRWEIRTWLAFMQVSATLGKSCRQTFNNLKITNLKLNYHTDFMSWFDSFISKLRGISKFSCLSCVLKIRNYWTEKNR